MHTDAVEAAMVAVGRKDFLPRRQRRQASVDAPLPIGFDQTNSQPRTVAAMLRLLDVRPGHRILDVGSGSGWTTALLAQLTGTKGTVIGVELVPELVRQGAANLSGYGFPHAIIVPAAPGVLGWPDEAPYDRILVSAAARSLPEALVEQLGPAGVLVVPVRNTMTRIENQPGASATMTEHGTYSFVPLR